MRWIHFSLTGFLVLLCTTAAWADGKVFSITRAEVAMPDQQALIHFDQGVETMVIETRFVGKGRKFAWVVPTPSPPQVEAATRGTFPTLREQSRPHVKTNVFPLYQYVILSLFVLGLLIFKRAWGLAAVVFILIGLALLPSLARPRALGVSAGPEGQVTVHQRSIVGDYAVATISSEDAVALVQWLEENDFQVDEADREVIAAYVKDGWYFTPIRLHREGEEAVPTTPHPLAFTFKTRRAVYPMRLTATAVPEGKFTLDLYVFSQQQAAADGFRTDCCVKTDYPKPEPKQWYSTSWKRDGISVVHPELVKWSQQAPVFTRLHAELTPDQMCEDIYLHWQPFERQWRTVWSHKAALIDGVNKGSVPFGVILVILFLLLKYKWIKRFDLLMAGGVTLLLSAGVAYGVYRSVPKIPVKQVGIISWYRGQHNHEWIVLALANRVEGEEKLDCDWARQQLEEIVQRHGPTPDPEQIHWRDDGEPIENPYTGELVCEEDSPGNYILRPTETGFEYVWFQRDGGEKIARFPEDLIQTSGPYRYRMMIDYH